MTTQTLQNMDSKTQPVRKAIRRLRWFKDSFAEQVSKVTADTKIEFAIDDRVLTAVFFEWLRRFEAQKPSDQADRRPYVGYAAGLMLQTLLSLKPLKIISIPDDTDESNPAFFWPEGYVYVAYCLNIRAAVLEQDFDEHRREVPEISELRTWWSFRENTEQDPALGIAFLDLFAGEDPKWSAPDVFTVGAGDINMIAEKYYRRRALKN